MCRSEVCGGRRRYIRTRISILPKLLSFQLQDRSHKFLRFTGMEHEERLTEQGMLLRRTHKTKSVDRWQTKWRRVLRIKGELKREPRKAQLEAHIEGASD